jgi:hypothetical protein
MAGASTPRDHWDFADEGLPIGQDPMFDDYEGER